MKEKDAEKEKKNAERDFLDLGGGTNPHPKAKMVLDLNPDIKKLGLKKAVVWDLNKVPYPIEDRSVDYIFCEQVMEHLEIDLRDFFRECHRILRIGSPDNRGTLEFITTNNFHYFDRLNYLFGNFRRSNNWHLHHKRVFKPSEVAYELRMSGFYPDIMPTTGFWNKIGLEKLFPDFFARQIHIKAKRQSDF